MKISLQVIVGLAALTLLALVCHAAIGAGSEDGGATAHAIAVNAGGEDTASIPDFDGDGMIGFGDFLKFAARFGLGQGDDGYDAQYDLNGDGEIGFTDFLILAENFGKETPPAGTGGSGGGGGTGGVDPLLTLQSFEVSDNSLTAGQNFTFETTVRNSGSTARRARLILIRSTDATIDTTDAYIYDGLFATYTPEVDASATQTLSVDWVAPAYAGVYYYGACVPDYGVFENCSSGVRVNVEGNKGGAPDLTVHSLSASQPIINPGGFVSFKAVVENMGTGPAAPATARIQRSDDAINYANDGGAHSRPSPHLGTESKWIWGVHKQVGQSTPAGTYYYRFCVDPTIRETNSGNNCSAGVPLSVKADDGSPDLIVVSPGILDHMPGRSQFRLWSIVQNTGSGLSSSTTLRYYRSEDPTIDDADAQIATRFVGGLGVEGTYGDGPKSHRIDFDNWSEIVTAPTSPGTYYYGACVDPVPGESDTNNNCSESVPMNVGVPDLAVGLAWASTSVPLADESFTFRATVRNQGPVNAAATTLRIYRSDDAAIDAGDTPIGAGTVSSLMGFDGLVSGPGSRLAASGTSRQAIRVTAPSSPGTYYYGACVDDVPGETNIDNNCSAGAYVRVIPTGKDPFNIELVFSGDFADARKDVMQQAARRWETIIKEGLPDVDFSANPFVFIDEDGRVAGEIDDGVDDLRIFVHMAELGGTVIGRGGPDFVRSGNPTGLPALGRVWIGKSFLTRIQQSEPLWMEERLLGNLMLHEIAHVLGYGPLWADLDLLHDLAEDTYFSGERAIEAFNAAGGETYSGNKVPVEFGREGGGCGSPAHWREHVFQGFAREFGAEIMEPTVAREERLSAITIQSLADLGYVVDVSHADPYRLPASVSTYQPPTAGAKPVANYGELDMGPHGTIHVGDEQGNIIRTIDR